MPSESGDKHPAKAQTMPPPKTGEALPCPRCNSTNTKFCYYNNYNLSQPRHFCKACRRYWTHGGALRNVPFGGGTRKNSKRSRSSQSSSSTVTTATSTSSSSSTTTSTVTHEAEPVPGTRNTNPVLVLSAMKDEGSDDLNLNESMSVGKEEDFSSYLNSQGQGLVGADGYGYGSVFGVGFCDMGLGFGGRGGGVWSYPVMSYPSGGNGGASGSGNNPGSNTWQQLAGVEAGGDEDCFAWPGLAISTPGETLK